MSVDPQIEAWVLANSDKIKDAYDSQVTKDSTASQTARDASVVTAQSWFDTSIKPTLTLNTARPLDVQRGQVLADFATLETLLGTEPDVFKKLVLRQEMASLNTKFKQIKKDL